jgi:hypothetical protein
VTWKDISQSDVFYNAGREEEKKVIFRIARPAGNFRNKCVFHSQEFVFLFVNLSRYGGQSCEN